MDVPPNPQIRSYPNNKWFLTCSYTSKEEFVREYNKLCYEKAKELYLLISTELGNAVSNGDVNSLKKFSELVDYISDVENQVALRDRNYYNNHLESTNNLVILACKHSQVKILKYLFGKGVKFLNNLSFIGIGRTILPDDEDDMHHNAFYYAIRSGNIELLNMLINKWPDNYFTVHLGELDEIISEAYDELKLKNILLSDKIEIFVQDKLINLRFFSNNIKQDESLKVDLNNICKRFKLVLQSINLLNAEYSNTKEVDEKFLFIAKFIAQNIHLLKLQLKSTYNILPWEEMEFCLVIFVSSYIKQREINLFCNIALNKCKILNYLHNFAKILESNKNIIEGVNICELAELPKLKREKVVAEITSSYPQFEELYNDYQEIRDIYSLEKINNYIKLTLSVDPKQKEGQLIIVRALQVISEYLKNTLESPNLSNTRSKLLLLSLPQNTREAVIDLSNSLSYAYSLSKRIEMEKNKDINFFINVQNDTKKIGDVITNILINSKSKIFKILLEKFINSESLDDIKEVAKIFSNIQLEEVILKNCIITEHEKLESLIEELNNSITEKTSHEQEMLNKISDVIYFVKTKSENMGIDYITIFESLKRLTSILSNNNKIDYDLILVMKSHVNKILKNIVPPMEPYSLKEIAELSNELFCSVWSRTQGGNLDKVYRLTCEIFHIVVFGTGDIKSLVEFREKLIEKGSFIPMCEQRKIYNIVEEKYEKQLAQKLSELKTILRNNSLSSELIEKLPSYKSNKKLQAVVEMLVLDIMSILGSSKNYLENNLLFLDDNTPLLTGKCLRNHLAHENALVDVMLSDPSVAVILNARKLISEDIMKSKKKVGKLVKDEPFKLKDKYDQGLVTIANQKKMFAALKEGNFRNLKNSLEKGADINARSINSWTALHFAAKGPSLEIIKFLLNQNMDVNVKDINGQSPLHIAVAHGRKDIVKFFVEDVGSYVNDLDNRGKTPLHIAAQNGYKDIIEVLLKNKANTVIPDMCGLSPLFDAIRNNHVDVAKVLLEKDVNANEAVCGRTPLHEATESGHHLELVNFLLLNKANINARNDIDWTPLHVASFNGHLEVVNTLILKGANVNDIVINGCTALHYAVESGHEKIVNALLKYGANVNVVDKTYNHSTPLHNAAKAGHVGIVKSLLKYNADVSVTTTRNMTPLHLAAQDGHLEIVVVLLEHGVNIHVKDKNNASPLYYAVENGHKEVAELLIKNRAEVNTKTNDNFTPLHVAALKGYNDIIDILIKNKASVNVQDIKGATPLHCAAMNGSKDVIDLLIKNNVEVCARTNDGATPLHLAALNGHKDAVVFLIKNKADVNAEANERLTPLHAAVLRGHKDIVNFLIKNKSKVNARDIKNNTPLHLAVEAGNKDIVEILVANGSNVNVKSDNSIPLLSAIKYNYKEIVEILVANGAHLNAEPLLLAVFAGYSDTLGILLKNEACINIRGSQNDTLLHVAAANNRKEIVSALIRRGADVNAVTFNNATPLHLAAFNGYEEVVAVLIASGAKIDFKNDEGLTPLHMAAANGCSNVVKFLLDNEANIDIKDNENKTLLERAVLNGHLEVTKMLLQHKKIDMNAKGNNDLTILHIASGGSNLELVNYLVDEGSNIDAKNASGSKPIHIAAREGHKDIVVFFLKTGLNVNEPGTDNKILLHYAAMKDKLEVTQYLIAQCADVNAKDLNGFTPMHIAAYYGCKDVIKVLLKNGAIYNAVDKLYRKPLEITQDKDVIMLLTSTEGLFEAVKHNSSSKVENYIKAGTFVNAKNANSVTPLHYAAWKGYDGVVNVLLQNEANPNAVGNNGSTPLHYAAKFSHLKVVKALFSHGAVYNAVSDCGKTPSDFSVDKSITSLFKLVSKSFKKVKDGNAKVIDDINKIKDFDTIKAIMNAHNEENKTLIVAAVHNKFSKVEQLKQVLQNDVSSEINIALLLYNKGDYQGASSIFKRIFEERKKILGPNNPGTLDIQTYIARVLFGQGACQEALNMIENIFQKQKEMFGLNDKNTLATRSMHAFLLYNYGKDEEASSIFEEVYPKQKEILGPNHSVTLETQFHMALILNRQGKYEEALNITRAAFEKKKETSHANDITLLMAQNNTAMILTSQGKYEEALNIYTRVFEKMKVSLGVNHRHTLNTLNNIAGVLFHKKKYNEAFKTHQEVLNIQKEVFGQSHPDTLNTQYTLANMFFDQGKWISALKVYKEALDRRIAVFGSSHFSVLDILNKLKFINYIFKLQDNEASDIPQYMQKDIKTAASNGDLPNVQRLLKDGADVNHKDIDGRTPLHYAVSNGHISVVDILLKHGADVTLVSNKGNTPLHIATSKSYKEIVEVLLQHVSRDKLDDFINAKTTSGGTTSLHVAAKNCSLEVTKSLLQHGAAYNIENKEGETPIDLSKNQKVRNLLKLVEELFENARNGNLDVITKLKTLKRDEFIALTNVRNNQGNTLLQVGIVNKHNNVVNNLLEMLNFSRR